MMVDVIKGLEKLNTMIDKATKDKTAKLVGKGNTLFPMF